MHLQGKIEDINRRFGVIGKDSNIVIWGGGKHTSKLFEKTRLLSYNIKNIVDIDIKKQGESFFGFIIKNPKEINWRCVDSVVVSAFGKERQIADMLKKELGFSGNIVTLYMDYEKTQFYLLHEEKEEIYFWGDYKDWEEAYSECNGYEDGSIINTVIHSVKKVINGDALWERDGAAFYEQKYVYSICASVLRSAIENCGHGIRILDIGGGLGSTYFQNRKYLKDIVRLEWVIAEQDNYADYGHRNLESESLKFIKSSDNWEDEKFDIILMSGSLQYMRDYEEIANRVKAAMPDYIIIDRIMIGARMRICKQVVQGNPYKGSYPVRIFTEKEIERIFGGSYKIIEKDIGSTNEKMGFSDGIAESMYYVWRRAERSR